MNLLTELIIPLLAFSFYVLPIYALPSIGEIVAERAGILNIGIEGYMLLGALIGYLAAHYSGSPWLGLLAAAVAGALLSLSHAYLSITLGASQIISGIGINIFALGLTGFWYRVAIGGRTTPWVVETFGPIMPSLTKVPVVGPIFFQQNVLVYISIFLALICTILLYRTTFGLKLRATGEDPLTAETAGANVHAIRYIAVMVCGVFAGMGGAYLSLGYMSYFVENVTQGRGFIALAITIVGGWNPLKALAVSIAFGFTDSLQFRLQILGIGIAYPFLKMLPYALTIVTLLIRVRSRVRPPKALCIPYTKETK